MDQPPNHLTYYLEGMKLLSTEYAQCILKINIMTSFTVVCLHSAGMGRLTIRTPQTSAIEKRSTARPDLIWVTGRAEKSLNDSTMRVKSPPPAALSRSRVMSSQRSTLKNRSHKRTHSIGSQIDSHAGVKKWLQWSQIQHCWNQSFVDSSSVGFDSIGVTFWLLRGSQFDSNRMGHFMTPVFESDPVQEADTNQPFGGPGKCGPHRVHGYKGSHRPILIFAVDPNMRSLARPTLDPGPLRLYTYRWKYAIVSLAVDCSSPDQSGRPLFRRPSGPPKSQMTRITSSS